ncbi:HpcH/HpaI aldolase/citrate lyase family protein [Pseudahrensia aquimaris]|uniref:HpcH/HpaI aldolase/citrate lyase family protein n=1 Tax=Pseudahrensia aquimaris TaxID=744461 RepID=A0ABW3FCD4_9HYPH
MRANTIKQRLANGDAVINAWLSIGSSYSAEGMAHAGFHSATVDLQHGMFGFETALQMLQAISTSPAIPLVRVPGLEPTQIMQVLDAGAYGVICPMISTAPEAEKLVSACKYPPVGTRSFGPSRGLLYGGPDYVAKANETIMAIPMIETEDAVTNIDAILAVDGVDMIYIGPNDLAFNLEGSVGFPRTKSESAISHILKQAQAQSVPVGIFCADAEEARRRLDAGFAMVTPANDFGHLIRSGTAAVARLLEKKESPGSPMATVKAGY